MRKRSPAGKVVPLAPRGGLIVVGGPPFGGRGPLAAALCDWLPRAVKLETVESLVRESFPSGAGTAVGGARAGSAVLAAAVDRLRAAGPRPTVIVVARFERPERRLEAYERALELGAAFLYVEARSSNIRSIRRLFRLFDRSADPSRKLARYEQAVRRYVPLSALERSTLPCIALRSVLSDLDGACTAVLTAWHGRA